MPQKKINSFFNNDKYSGSTSRFSAWNQSNPLQKYHESRKQAKIKQMKEVAGVNCEDSRPSTQSSQFTHSFEMIDDSCSQRTDNGLCSNFNGNGNYGFSQAKNYIEKSCFSGFSQTQKKREFEQYKEIVKQEQRERHESEMLNNFLLCAKQCFEDTNDVAKDIYEKLDESTSKTVNETILKMKECLEKIVPELLKIMKENNNEKENIIDKKLMEMQSELKHIETTNENCCEKCVITIENNHKATRDILQEIRCFLNKPKPVFTEIGCQYSPQLLPSHFIDAACQYSPQFSSTIPKSIRSNNNLSLNNSIDVHSRKEVGNQNKNAKRTQIRKPLSLVNENWFSKSPPKSNADSNLHQSKIVRKRTPKKVLNCISPASNNKSKSRAWLFKDDVGSPKLSKAVKRGRKNAPANGSIRTGENGSVMKAFEPQKKNWNFGSSKKAKKGPHYSLPKSPGLSKTRRIPWIVDQLSFSEDESDSTYDFPG